MTRYGSDVFELEMPQKTSNSSVCFGCCYCSKREKCVFCSVIWLPILSLIVLFLGLVINSSLLIDDPFILHKINSNQLLINATRQEIIDRAITLGKAIQIKTISYSPGKYETENIKEFHTFLKNQYPKIYECPWIEQIPIEGTDLSLLFKIKGKKDNANPYLLLAHIDVVPEGNVSSWKHDPFLGEILEMEDGKKYIYGRGAMDNKHNLMGIMEVIDHLVKNQDQPNRSFYFAMGHDEEVLGLDGAANIAKTLQKVLQQNNEKLDFIIDEGMMVLDHVFPGVDDYIVYIGVVEKTLMNLELSVEGSSGHSSVPPRENSIVILSKALVNLHENLQPSKFGEGPEYDTMRYMAPHSNFFLRLALGNLWLMKSTVSSILTKNYKLDALQRTTTAITIVEGGIKDNVIPPSARAIVNHRIHPRDSPKSIIQRDEEIIDDSRVKIKQLTDYDVVKISPYDNNNTAFQTIANSALDIYQEAHIVPGIMVGATDSRHFMNLTNQVYRFSPIVTKKTDLERIHGFNERLSLENYERLIEFYHRVIKNSDVNIQEKRLQELSEEDDDGSGSGSGSGDIPENELNVAKDYEIIDDKDF